MVLSWTYLLSPLAYLAAVPLGMLARTDAGGRGLGIAAFVLAVLAVGAANVTLVWG